MVWYGFLTTRGRISPLVIGHDVLTADSSDSCIHASVIIVFIISVPFITLTTLIIFVHGFIVCIDSSHSSSSHRFIVPIVIACAGSSYRSYSSYSSYSLYLFMDSFYVSIHRIDCHHLRAFIASIVLIVSIAIITFI